MRFYARRGCPSGVFFKPRSGRNCCGSNKAPPQAAKKAHGVCRPGRDKLSAKRKVSKGFNFVRGKLLFWCADSRFGKPRISFGKGFNFVSAELLFG